MGTVKDFVAFIFIGTCLLATLAACETSKHAEIMSMEDLRAQAPMPAAPAADTGLPFEGKPRKSLGLSEPFDITPEPPPGPASPAPASKAAPPAPKPAAPAPKPAAPAPKPAAPASKPAPSAPEPIVEETVPAEEPVAEPKIARPEPSDFVPEAPQPVPEPEPAPAPPVSEPKPAPPAPEPIVEETVPAEEPVAEPKMEIAKLEPSDFVPELPQPEPAPAPPASEPKPDSGLADVFFDFDQYAIRSDAIPILEKDAELMKSTYQNSGVLIEGHCDERGTVEYNLELGKRRAQAVKDYLVDLGIEESRIQIVSYGKERPFCTESNESCFQQNRRGHFVRQ